MVAVDFTVVKKLVSIYNVLDLIGWKPLTKIGDQWRGACPVHRSQSSRSRSFAVCKTGFFCHGCKANGDQIALYAMFKGLTFPSAAVELCREHGFEIPYLPRLRRAREREKRNGEEER
jgi:DNA primase